MPSLLILIALKKASGTSRLTDQHDQHATFPDGEAYKALFGLQIQVLRLASLGYAP
jgi:hypothetical protein